MTDPRPNPTAPGTRDLRELLDAIAIVEAELRFQSQRLTNSPNEYLARMSQRYDEATGTLVTLRRYQEGRVQEQDARRSDYNDTVNAEGVAIAHIEDEDDGN